MICKKTLIHLFKASTLSLACVAALSSNAQSNEGIEILIEGGLVEMSRDTVGTSTTLITSSDIEKQGAQFVSDVLKSVPGLSVSRSGGAGSVTEVRIRGAETGHTLVLIDGIEANDPGSGSSFSFANLLADNVERIEIFRGAQSAIWGSDAIGGVINIVTKSGRNVEGNEFSLAAEGGSFNTQKYATGVRGNGAGFDYALSVQHYQSDGFSSASENTFSYTTTDGRPVVTGGNSEDDGYENTTAHFKLGYALANEGRIQAVVRHTDYNNDFDSFGDVPIDGDIENTDGEASFYGLSANVKQLEGKLGHTFRLGKNEREADNLSSSGTSRSESEKTNYAYQMDYNWLGNGNGVSLVLENEEDALDSDFSGSRSIENQSIVTEYRFQKNNTSFAANVRHDDNDFFDSNTVWRLAGSQKISDTARLHATYGTSIKNPTLIELFGFSPEFVGNANLEAETAKGGDIGVEFTIPNGVIDITYFDLKIDDLITGAGDSAINIAGESSSRGIELTSRHDLSDALSLNAAYTFNDTEDAQGQQLIRRPEHELNIGLESAMMNDALRLGVNLRHVMDFSDITFNPDFSTSNVNMRDFTVVDLSSKYELANGLNLRARIDNVLDEEYEEVLGYGSSERAYYLGLGYTF